MQTADETEKLVEQLAESGLEMSEPIQKVIEIFAPAQDVWRVISKAGNLINYHPFCEANPVHEWPGVGARDEVVYYSGLVYQRDFIKWLEGVGYDLEIGPNPTNKSAKVSWRIDGKTDALTELSIEVTPYLKIGMPEARRQAYLDQVFGDVIASYLESVVKGVDTFVISGVAVRGNQFGSHPLYSSG
ncbi:MAG: hypothetical protein AB9Q22_00040 [Candidatus Reddybacter sp.]